MLDLLVRSASLLIVALVIAQFFNRKGERVHLLLGGASGFCGFVLFVAVCARGYLQYGQSHGWLYPFHLLLGSLFFVALAALSVSGTAMVYRIGSRFALYRAHRLSAWMCVALLVSSLGLGIASYFSPR